LSSVPREIAGSASGSFSMMRYVGSVVGAALLAAMLGSDASRTEFHALFAILAAFAVVNLVTAFIVHTPRAQDTKTQGVPKPLTARG